MSREDHQVLADRLNDAWAELRRLPIGGRGHLVDIYLEAAEALRAMPPTIQPQMEKVHFEPGDVAVLRLHDMPRATTDELVALREQLRTALPEGVRAMVVLTGELTGRFDLFTVGELQALVLAFSAAGAYDVGPRPPWNHPVWASVARDASRTLERAAADEGWDERRGPAASGDTP